MVQVSYTYDVEVIQTSTTKNIQERIIWYISIEELKGRSIGNGIGDSINCIKECKSSFSLKGFNERG